MEDSFSANGFLARLSRGQLSTARCRNCQNYIMPPTSMCNKCLSTDLEWVNLNNRGKVISFSEVYISNKEFQAATPYVVGIVETVEGVRLAGMIKNVRAEEIQIGARVSINISLPSSNAAKNVGAFYFALVH